MSGASKAADGNYEITEENMIKMPDVHIIGYDERV